MLLPRILTAALALILCSTSGRAQLAPPNQEFVANIGSLPFMAPATADFAPGASFTLEGWFYLTAHHSFSWLMGKGLATAGVDPFVSFGVHLDNAGTRVAFNTSTGVAGSARSITSPSPFPLNKWTHVAAVQDNGVTRLLINGSVVATGVAMGPPLSAPTIPLGIGVAYQGNGSVNFNNLPAFARQIRFWNVARTAAQISSALSESLPSDRTGLVAAWPLDESTGTTARDLSGAARALSTTQVIAIRSTSLAAGPFYAAGTPTPLPNVGLGVISSSALIDFDSDGDDDLVIADTAPATVPETRTRLRALRNNAGNFAEVTDAVIGNVTMVNPRQSLIGDFNGDGRLDLFVPGHGTDRPPYPGEQSKLFIQSADGRLVDETATRLPARISFTHGASIGDIDGDGDLDIYMNNIGGGEPGIGPRFYINNGSALFTEATDRLPTEIANRVNNRVYTSSVLVDVNGDRRLDLVLGGISPREGNELLINDGTGRFARDPRNVLPTMLYADSGGSTVAISSADFNGDGKPDLAMATTGGQTVIHGVLNNGYEFAGLQLLLNRGDGTFTDATAASGFTWRSTEKWVVWPRIVDLDGDGRPDILAQELVGTKTSVAARIFLNRGNAQFIDATEAYPIIATTGFVHASDFDRDGKIDLITVSTFINPSAVTVARNVKPLDRNLFQTGTVLPSRLSNLSVLTSVSATDPQFTVGTVVRGGGTGGVKPLLIRAAGPSLIPLGVAGVLADPKLEVFSGATVVAANDNWNGTAALNTLFSQVGAFAYASPASLDSAVAYSAPSADLTVQVSGVGNTAGAVIAELYDATPAAAFSATTPRLINVSVLKQIDSGGILTVGFVIEGVMPKQVLIRAVGPTLALAPFGIGNAMSDPKLELFLGQTVIASNDNWGGGTSLSTAFANVGAFALGATSRDAVVLVTLFPGNYTVQVSGVAGGSGLAIAEVYESP